MPLFVTAAAVRARALTYCFTLLCVGLLVLLIVVLVESHKWRTTITSESQVAPASFVGDMEPVHLPVSVESCRGYQNKGSWSQLSLLHPLFTLHTLDHALPHRFQ